MYSKTLTTKFDQQKKMAWLNKTRSGGRECWVEELRLLLSQNIFKNLVELETTLIHSTIDRGKWFGITNTMRSPAEPK